jgi:hypothetical protein
MQSFLSELQELQTETIKKLERDDYRKIKENFKKELYAYVFSMRDSVQNEFRRLVQKKPAHKQFYVQRTFTDCPDEICLFFQTEKSEYSVFMESLQELYPWCKLHVQLLPSHQRRNCDPLKKHYIHITFTLFL